MKTIIGVDPDSKKHGVAIYVGNKLVRLFSWELIDFFKFFTAEGVNTSDITVHIEDVCVVRASFTGRDKGVNINTKLKMAKDIGRCQQSQVELERVFEYFGIEVVKHKICKSWKSQVGKKQFKQLTGWVGLSNEDTRSAAYFGFLGCK